MCARCPIHQERRQNQRLDLALLGGKDGMAITDKLLRQLEQILSPDGVAYILFCARNKPKEVIKRFVDTTNGM